MSFSQLPTELQSHIVGYLGQEFFRQDVRHLTVSRSWHDLAWRVMVKHLQLTTRSMVKFTKHEAVLARSQTCVSSVKLSFRKFDDPTLLAQTDDIGNQSKVRDAKRISEWNSQINSSLQTLSATLRQCPQLRRLEIEEGPDLYILRGRGSEPLAWFGSRANILLERPAHRSLCGT